MATTYSNVLLRFDGKISIAAGSTPVKIQGSNGADTVTIESGAEVLLDGSFNRGNDVINFTGLASSYSIVKLNSSSILVTDALGTSVTIPVGSVGATLQFADASRELKGSAAGITLGTQTVSTTAASVAAGSGIPALFAPNPDVGALPGANPAQANVVVLAQDAKLVLGADTDPTTIRGSNGADTVTIGEGSKVVLDGSFNRGNDTIVLTGNAADYTVAKSGSSAIVITDAAGTSVTIPVGSTGAHVQFADADRVLKGSSAGITLGDQLVSGVPTQVTQGTSLGHVFTLTEAVTPGTPSHAAVTHQEVYWGYSHPASDGPNNTNGIPLATLIDFVTKITGLDLKELGLIDDNGNHPFDNVTNFTLSNALSLTQSADNAQTDSHPQLRIDYSDGTFKIFNVEAQIGEQYFEWLNSLLFDDHGHSRLFMKEIVDSPSSSGSSDTLKPIVLTPTQNNGGTLETGKTGAGDDLIVAGRLELLHQAYIDGGAGYNTLQIDAKGTYAQPAELINIQEIQVIDLPNFYTVDYGSGDGNLSNTQFDGAFTTPTGSGSDDSWIDLSNAHQIRKLVVTDQGRSGSYYNNNGNESTGSGNLFVVGVQNGAVLRLEGAFVSGTTTVQYGPGINTDNDGKFNLELAIGETSSAAAINIVQNLDVMEIKSEGIANNLDTFFGGGHLSQLFIKGTGHFAVDSDIGSSFDNSTPIVINASANSGGVDLRLSGAQNVDIVGSTADDRFIVNTSEVDGWPGNDEVVTINGGSGDNYYEVHGADKVAISNADGDNDYEIGDNSDAVAEVIITTGNGDNTFEIANVAVGRFTAGNGNNRFDIGSPNEFDYNNPSNSLEFPSDVTVVAGNGKNVINVDADIDIGKVNVTVGSGGNEVHAYGHDVTISASGTAANEISALGDVVTINVSGSTGSRITVAGADVDYARSDELGGNLPQQHSSSEGDDGALLTINAGRNATIYLGADSNYVSDADNNFPFSTSSTITANEGSSITGTNVTLVVMTEADLRAASLTGVSKVVLDDDSFDLADAPLANEAEAGYNASVLTLTSTQFKAIGAANFSVQGAVFNTHAFVKIIVDSTTSLSALGVDNLPRNIDLLLEVQDGVTLTMTAQQLHTRVAEEGVTLANDGNTDLGNGKVVITGGGINFDPFNTNDNVQSVINGTSYLGGSLSNDFMVNGSWYNVKLNSVFGGYDRPADAPLEQFLTIDSNITPTVAAFDTFHTNLLIIGDDNMTYTGAFKLGMQNVSGTEKPTNPFSIDFSTLSGTVSNLTVDNFELLSRGGGIFGNSALVAGTQVFAILENDATSTNGFDDANAKALVMSGVEKLTITQIDGTNGTGTIKLGDTTQGLSTLAFRGNYNDTLNVVNPAWGLTFELQGGTTAAADGPTGTSNVGRLVANYEFPGASAVVNLTHAVATDTRPIKAYGIDLNGAKSITVNTGTSTATIDAIEGDANTKTLAFSGAGVTIGSDVVLTNLTTIDASAVFGNFTLTTGTADPAAAFTFLASAGTTTLTMQGMDAPAGSSFSANAAATFNIVVKDGPSTDKSDLSAASLVNVDKLTIVDAGTVLLTASQAVTIGLANIAHSGTGTGVLDIKNLGNQLVDATTLGSGNKLGAVSIATGTTTLDPGTKLTGATVTLGATSTLNLTAAQYMALADLDGVAAGAKINITGVTQADIDAGFTLSNVSNATGTVSFVGSVNLKSTTAMNGFTALVDAGATLGVASSTQADGLKVTGGANAIVKFLFNNFATSDHDIDVSKYAVSKVVFPASLVVNSGFTNIDQMLTGVPATLVKEVYNNTVQLVDQTFNVSAGTTVSTNVTFDRTEQDLELRNFTLNLDGGAKLSGSVNLAYSANSSDLIQTYMQTLTINSTGTAGNLQSNDTTNYVTGNIGALAGSGLSENEILNVVINASQNLVIGGTLSFTSVINTTEVATLTVNGDKNVTITEISTQDDDVDGLNVVNAGTGTLTLGISGSNIDATDVFHFTGTGPITLSIGGSVDLSDDVLTSVKDIVLEAGSNLTLTMAQADTLGASHFSAPTGAGAILNLVGLAGEPFAKANYDVDINVGIVTIAALPVVTLNAATNLTGIGSLVVPKGTVLNLTAAQFQQLSGAGSITGVSGTTDFTVNITDLAQANVGTGLDLSGVTADHASLTLVGDVNLGASSHLGHFDVAIGAHKLTLADIQQANGITFTGSTLEFLDPSTGLFESINASHFNVTSVRFLNTLTDGGNRNIDSIFSGIPQSVLKVVFQGEGVVQEISQTVTIEAKAAVTDSLVFNPPANDTELQNFTLNMQGGVDLAGNLRLSTTSKQSGGVDLLRTYLQKVTINSTGTDTNPFTGVAANVIHGNITPMPLGPGATPNNLMDITINATQKFVLDGGNIVFNNIVGGEFGGDSFAVNDHDGGTAKLTITGSAAVTIAGVDISDTGITAPLADIVGLNVVNSGTGLLTLTIDDADAAKVLSFTGTGDIDLIADGGNVDLSGDTLTAVDHILVTNGSTLVLNQGQYSVLGGANIHLNDGDTGTLNIVQFGSAPFDASTIDPDFNVNLFLVSGNTTLTGNFTGVDSLNVIEGSTVTMTAAQFQSLQGTGTINVLDGADAGGVAGDSGIHIVITGLTQAQVDAGFDLGGVNVGTGGTVSISLGEPSVTLGTYVAGVLQPGSDANIFTNDGVQADFKLASGQTLGLATTTQANHLDVDGTGTTTIVYKFVPFLFFPQQLDASGYDVTFLRALASGFTGGQQNVEVVIDELASSVTLVLYQDPAQLGFLDPTFRVIEIESGITTPTGLIVNDWDPEDEVRALDLTLDGGVVVNGDLRIPSRTDKLPLQQVRFENLVIHSEGTSANRINGNISTATILGAPNTSVNNLLNVTIDAQQALIIGDDATAPFVFTTGRIIFEAFDTSGANNQVATLNVTGPGNVWMKGLDTTDAEVDAFDTVAGDIGTLVVNHTGTGVLTITGGSDAINLGANTATLTFKGQGDIVLDTDTGAGNNGVFGVGLKLIDASQLTGDLTLGVIEEVSNAAFTLKTGNGVTKATLIDNDLDSRGTDTLPNTTDDTAGWLIDYTAAAAGSEFHLAWGGVATPPPAGSKLTINMGANGVLYIDGPAGSSVDLSDLVLDINSTHAIVLGDEVTLTLTAAQADGLHIIAGPDTDLDGNRGTVNIVDLGDAPVDLSGIDLLVAGTATLVDDDVTLDPATVLGAMSITLDSIKNTSAIDLDGQTIRFTTIAQADGREIIVNETAHGGLDDNDSSTNVVWLFNDIPHPLDTSAYDGAIGRLWVTPALVTAEGGLVESLFTTLPSSILRVEFSSLSELNVLLAAQAVDRTVEFVHFTNLGNLTFSDVGSSPDEFDRTIDLRMGGQVTLGNVNISDVIGGANVDPNSVYFDGITLDSFRAVERTDGTTGEILSAAAYRNDNDGVAEVVSGSTNENVAPTAPNTVGNITGDDTNAHIDLLDVSINTHLLRTTAVGVGPQTPGISAHLGALNNDRGEAIVVGTITFDSSGTVNPLSSHGPNVNTANLNVTGANNVTIAAVNTADTDISTLAINLTGFTAILDPVLHVDNTETITITNANVVGQGTAIFEEVEGNELSFFNASNFDGTLTATISQIDSTNEDRNPVPDGSTDQPADYAFNFTAGQGVEVITLKATGGDIPTLNTDQDWLFTFTGAAAGSQLVIDQSVVFQPSGDLHLVDVPVYITGNVNLSQVDLDPQGSTMFHVAAGNSLTISVAQALQLAAGNFLIVGEGTVKIVGDGSDGLLNPAMNASDFGESLRTAVVDLSAVTLDLVGIPGATADADSKLALTSLGARNLDNTANIGQTLIGSNFDDVLAFTVFAGNDLDYTFKGGAGDDLYNAFGSSTEGDYTYLVESGTDTIYFLNGQAPGADAAVRQDVLKVSAGATANANVASYISPAGFIATAETSNAGTANIIEDGDPFAPGQQSGGVIIVDLTLATGPNGYNVLMQTDDTIVGSVGNDTINGGNDLYSGTIDTLTGKEGADLFVFNVNQTNPADPSVTQTTVGVDGETVNVTVAGAGVGQLTIDYHLNGIAGTVLTAAVDASDVNAVEAAIATALNGLLGVSAQVSAGVVVATGDNQASFEIDSITSPLPGVTADPTYAFGDGDTGAVWSAVIPGTVAVGEVYSLTLTVVEFNTNLTANYEVQPGDSPTDVANNLVTIINGFAGAPFTASNVGATITVQDGIIDDGGFVMTSNAIGTVNGSGASAVPVTEVSMDVITDFQNGADHIHIEGMAAGTGANFDSGAVELTFAAALISAQNAFTGGASYYMTSVDTAGPSTEYGVLFFDANGDSFADGAIRLEGMNAGNFTANMIA